MLFLEALEIAQRPSQLFTGLVQGCKGRAAAPSPFLGTAPLAHLIGQNEFPQRRRQVGRDRDGNAF